MTGFHRQCARFGKFNLVGLMGAVLQLLTFDLLFRYLQLAGAAAAAFSVEIAVLHNFLWHERFTWSDRQPAGLRQRAARLLRFHLSNGLIPLTANALLISWLVERLGAPALPSALAAIAVCAPLNFLLADRWVYGEASFFGFLQRRACGKTLAGRIGPGADAILIESRRKKLQHSERLPIYPHFSHNKPD